MHIKGGSQTTFTRREGQVFQKSQLFVNDYMTENVNVGGKVVKKDKNMST